MGTKLHGVHKLVTSLMKNESYGIVRKGSKNHPESWEIFQNIFPKTNFRIWFNHFRKDSMDRFHQQYNRELVRNTILKHEEIFRQQVIQITVYTCELISNNEFHTQRVNGEHKRNITMAFESPPRHVEEKVQGIFHLETLSLLAFFCRIYCVSDTVV